MEENTEFCNSIKKTYRPRVIDSRINDMLSAFGGVLITGPKWCGKSWTGVNHTSSSIMLGNAIINEYAKLSPEKALAGKYPRLVDEWQDAPELWDAARRRIDFENRKGMYIFTGSSFPKAKVYHTGTGRFARVEMRTMSMFETGDSNGSISLSKLFSDGRTDPTPSEMDYMKAVRLICRGGWPGSLGVEDRIAMKTPSEYLRSIVSADLSILTETRKNPAVTERILRSLARSSASEVKMSTIVSDISEDGREVSEQTIRSYIDSLKQIYVVEEQPAWSPSLRSRGRLRTSPKLHLTDPSLAAAALGATPKMLEKDVKTAGLLFESLCYRDICVYSDELGGKVYHYRDNTGLEIDNIMELPDGRWGAAEIKLGHFEIDKAAENLLRLNNKMEVKATFLSVITATGRVAHTRDDGVSVIPIDLLGP